MIDFYNIEDDLSLDDKNAIIYLIRKFTSFTKDFVMDSSVVGDYGTYLLDFKSEFGDTGLVYEDDVTVPLRVKLTNPLFETGVYYVTFKVKRLNSVDNGEGSFIDTITVPLSVNEWVEITDDNATLINILDYDFTVDIKFNEPLINLNNYVLNLNLNKSIVDLSIEESVNLSATLTDVSGNLLVGKNIKFYNGLSLIDTATTNNNGIANLVYTPSTSGVFNLKVVYKQNESSVVSLTVAPVGNTLDLTVDNSIIGINKSVTCNVVLTDIHDDINNKEIKFYNDGNLIGTATTNNNGECSFTYTPINTGDLSLTAKYNNAISNIIDVSVVDVDLSLSANTNIIDIRNNVILTGSLLVNNVGVNEASVLIYDGSTLLDTVITDNLGEFSYYTSSNSKVTKTYHAVYNGSNIYPSKTSDTVSVEFKDNTPTSISLSSNVNSIKVNDSVLLTATVTDVDNDSCSGFNIDFYDGDSLLGTVTVEDGECSFVYTPTTSSTLNLTAKYDNIVSNSVSVVVNKIPTVITIERQSDSFNLYEQYGYDVNHDAGAYIQGYLTDDDGKAMGKTNVIVYSTDYGISVTTKTDNNGFYQLHFHTASGNDYANGNRNVWYIDVINNNNNNIDTGVVNPALNIGTIPVPFSAKYNGSIKYVSTTSTNNANVYYHS